MLVFVSGGGLSIFSYLPQVGTHRRARGLWLAFDNCRKDAFMVKLTALWAALDLEDAHSLLTQQDHDEIKERGNQVVLCGFGQGVVKVEIGFNISLASSMAESIVQRLPESWRSVHPSRALQPGCNFWLKHLAYFDQVFGNIALTNPNHQTKRIAHSLRGTIGDESATARANLDQPFFPQCFDCLPHRRPTDAETITQLSLGRQLVTDLQFSSQYPPLDLFDDLFVEAFTLDGFIHSRALIM
jgi:hypothetical protein